MPRRKKTPPPPELGPSDPSICPVCGSTTWRLNRFFYCSAEDPHPGGVLITPEGHARRLDGGSIVPPISAGGTQ